MEQELDQRVINNGVASYFFLGWLMLFNKSNPLVDNEFVRGHAKTATLIHLSIPFSFFILSFFSFLGDWDILGISIYYIIQTLILFAIFSALVYGAFKAFNKENFVIGEIPEITKTNHLLEMSHNTIVREQDKTSVILNHIPFIGYLIYPKYAKYPTIRSVNKINLYSSIIILLFYTSGRYNSASLLLLLYIIYVVFTAIRLYSQDKIDLPNLEKVWSFEEIYIRFKAFVLYIYKYTNRDDRFREYALYLKIERAAVTKQAKLMLKDLLPRRSLPFKKWILYIPFVNLVGVFFLDTRYKTHIINGFCIDVMLILIWLIFGFDSPYSLFILFPISYGIAYQRKIDYRFPVMYDIAKVQMTAWSKGKEVVEEVNKIRKEETEVVLTPKAIQTEEDDTTQEKNTNNSKK